MGVNRSADVSTYIYVYTRIAVNLCLSQTTMGANLIMCPPTFLSTHMTANFRLCQPKRMSNFMGVRLSGCYQRAYISICTGVNLYMRQRAHRFQPAGVSSWVGVNLPTCHLIGD